MARKKEAALEERERYVQDLFRRVAPKYDFLNRLLSFRARRGVEAVYRAQGRSWSREAPYLTWPPARATSLLIWRRSSGPTGRVVGLDFTEEMLVRAREKADKLGLADVCRFVQGNALELPFEDAQFDAATIAFGLRNVVDRERCLLEMRRVVKPGGRVLVLEFSQPVWPVFRQVYLLYFRHILPFIGRLVQGDADTYRYLPETVLAFPDQEALAANMRNLGFHNVHYYNLSGGICCLHIGEV